MEVSIKAQKSLRFFEDGQDRHGRLDKASLLMEAICELKV
jgi:hypothetical protein